MAKRKTVILKIDVTEDDFQEIMNEVRNYSYKILDEDTYEE